MFKIMVANAKSLFRTWRSPVHCEKSSQNLGDHYQNEHRRAYYVTSKFLHCALCLESQLAQIPTCSILERKEIMNYLCTTLMILADILLMYVLLLLLLLFFCFVLFCLFVFVCFCFVCLFFVMLKYALQDHVPLGGSVP